MSYNNSIVHVYDSETFDERVEKQLSYFDHLPRSAGRNKPLDWNPQNNVCAVITRPEGNGFVKLWYPGANTVTNDGDIYYAKKAAGETPAANENFLQGRLQLANPTTQNPPLKAHTWDNLDSAVAGNNAAGTGAAIATSIKTLTATYPKTNDADSDNTGAGTNKTTYLYSYTTTDFNATGIKNGGIHDNASPVTATKLLTHFAITSFDKTSSDTLKLFVNHSFVGS